MDDNPKDYEERRRSLRVDLEAERVLLSWVDKDGIERTDDGICIDLSRRGLLFEYRQPFALGELVEVTFNYGTDKQNSVQGQICRCKESKAQSYHIAMQLI
ncbi:PilZ domain-containing protein [Shewanella litorisediminis]|uniref:PilZ domain-containing protein n=1 Tax=Shewanella litorisediminis TaxID=1173586 RepID=A0ABX7G6W5_9GAMM|nr:PilZ domain-containing protein [Shewanella litorisediminis]MCL2916811.1 PilZ domain-containing protein [Shewanella litorisediminis]QRH03022.1 PilZ domain-containing protein [Shewanella litorisediminis]